MEAEKGKKIISTLHKFCALLYTIRSTLISFTLFTLSLCISFFDYLSLSRSTSLRAVYLVLRCVMCCLAI